MKIKGIGWLIIGVLICTAAAGDDSFRSGLSTVLMGLVFIIVFLIKQKYYPVGTGWFIAGGLVMAYLPEAQGSFDMMVGFAAGAVLLGIFFYMNWEIVQMMSEDLDESADRSHKAAADDPEEYADGEDAAEDDDMGGR